VPIINNKVVNMTDNTKVVPISIYRETKEKIDKMKVHPREPYAETIAKIVACAEQKQN
jgi:hypothetical protein